MKKKYVVSCDYDGKKLYLYDSWPQLKMVNFTDDINKAYYCGLKFNAKYSAEWLKCNGYDAKVEEVTVEEENRQDKTMWVSRDSDNNRLWLHPHSKPVLHTYRDYEGVEHKRWVSESQFEIDSNMYKEVTFENSPKPLIIGESSN